MIKRILSVITVVILLFSTASFAVNAVDAAPALSDSMGETINESVEKDDLSGSASHIVSEQGTLLYSLPKGGIDYRHERNYYKAYDGEALFATYYKKSTDNTGFHWYECLMVSKDEKAAWYYTTPVEWMAAYGRTGTVTYNGELWYYTYGAAMHVRKEDEPKNVFNLNRETGVAIYKTAEEAALDLLEYHTQSLEKEKEETAGSKVVLKINDTKVYVDGEERQNDVAPIIRNSRTMVPVRFVAESLGANVDWDGTERCATIEKGGTVIKIFIDKSVAKINDEDYILDSPAFINSGRTFVPIRFISEGFGATVEWDGETQTVTITE